MGHVAWSAAIVLAATLGLSAAQAAPVSYTDTHLYGTNAGRIDPDGSDAVFPNYVDVSDSSATRFSDSFDFSSFAYTTISSVTLTLSFAGAGPALNPAELWWVRILGSNDASATDDYFGAMLDILSPTSYVLTAASDTFGRDAFANTLGDQRLSFWFSELTRFEDRFRLRSAQITVMGDLTTPVPLPAAGFLLIAGLGGLAALRRRKVR